MRTQQNMKRGIWTVAVVCLALGAQAVTVINQTTGQLLFYDDFESAPAASSSAHPDTSGDYDPVATVVPGSSWLINETGPTNIQVTAYRGNGVNDPARPPPNVQKLRTRFMIWYPSDGVSAHGITKSDALSSANCLVFNRLSLFDGYESHDGTSYKGILPGTSYVPYGTWVPIEMVWYPTRQTVWVSLGDLNNGQPIQAHLYGAVPDVLDRFLFKTQTGENNNRFWVDDIEAEWVYNPGTLIVFP